MKGNVLLFVAFVIGVHGQETTDISTSTSVTESTPVVTTTSPEGNNTLSSLETTAPPTGTTGSTNNATESTPIVTNTTSEGTTLSSSGTTGSSDNATESTPIVTNTTSEGTTLSSSGTTGSSDNATESTPIVTNTTSEGTTLSSSGTTIPPTGTTSSTITTTVTPSGPYDTTEQCRRAIRRRECINGTVTAPQRASRFCRISCQVTINSSPRVSCGKRINAIDMTPCGDNMVCIRRNCVQNVTQSEIARCQQRLNEADVTAVPDIWRPCKVICRRPQRFFFRPSNRVNRDDGTRCRYRYRWFFRNREGECRNGWCRRRG